MVKCRSNKLTEWSAENGECDQTPHIRVDRRCRFLCVTRVQWVAGKYAFVSDINCSLSLALSPFVLSFFVHAGQNVCMAIPSALSLFLFSSFPLFPLLPSLPPSLSPLSHPPSTSPTVHPSLYPVLPPSLISFLTASSPHLPLCHRMWQEEDFQRQKNINSNRTNSCNNRTNSCNNRTNSCNNRTNSCNNRTNSCNNRTNRCNNRTRTVQI